ncbi:gluconate 2-dehydrogenase subunit 3 family protein [Sphingopyxis sp. MSC1_008]|jgi:gluconate 2-dehydrogenase gamma chain|uniref:gluconate 2-dehydrogenase subunit 3 family protein n=1 Tax=Sphingopyxis sp. MSC1_008 TaxID=2909265 RepID=UPI0020C0259E|nr:gluconate 2-dehydrogenase subunit 3 family protein [Sphingopyxis sp. MSC1_008]
MDQFSRRGVLRNIMLLAGVAAIPHGAAHALFDGPASLPPATISLLSAVADTIIPTTETPGAAEAGVPDRLQKMLANWATPKRRDEILGALQKIDGAARTEAGSTFAALSPADRLKTLKTFDTAHSGDPGYSKLKELVIQLYYLSEAGATVELRYEHNPGAWEPSIPVTAETRNYGGPGL